MRKIENQCRQGDVLLQPVAEIPSVAKAIPTPNRLVLAEGEATGHAHAMTPRQSDLSVYADGPQLFLEIRRPTALRHEEHAEILVQPGLYRVIRQVESWLDEVRQVAD